MPNNASSDTTDSERLERALAEYLRAEEKGKAPSEQAFIEQHPDLADELRSFFGNRAAMERMASPLQDAAEGPTQAPVSAILIPPQPLLRYLGDYELLHEIARGGMGVVYKARQVSLNRTVAVKMILSGTLASSADVQRFRVEAEAAANLDHPHIVPIYEVGEHQGQHYFSMKLVEGGSLRQLIPNGKSTLAPQAAAQLIATVARAVHHAHQRGVLHRDLKPANILLDAQGQPHVTDFGLAKPVSGGGELTQSGAIVGTPNYMAPEQARADKNLSTAVDVYSLGAVLYELLTGQPPFASASPVETLVQVTTAEPLSPRKLAPKIGRDLETICLKCLAKDPAQRYDSAASLANDLERYLRGEPISARSASTWRRTIQWAWRKPAVAILTMLTGLAPVILVVALVWHLYQVNMRLAESLIERAQTERLLHHRDKALGILREVSTYRRDDALRQAAIEVVSESGFREPQRLPFGQKGIFSLSDDGRLTLVAGDVHFWVNNQLATAPRVKVLETETGKTLFEVPWHAAGRISPVLNPHATALAVPENETTIQIYQVPSGERAARLENLPHLGPLQFSPDGAYLALANSVGTRVISLASGSPAKERKNCTFLAFADDHDVLVRENERIVRWNLSSNEAQPISPENSFPVAVSANGKVAALRQGTPTKPLGQMTLYDLEQGKVRSMIENLGQEKIAARLSNQGQWLAVYTWAEPNTVRIRNGETGKFQCVIAQPGLTLEPTNPTYFAGPEPAPAFDPASPAAAYSGEFLGDQRRYSDHIGTYPKTVAVWSAETGEMFAALPQVAEAAWSADARFLATPATGTFMHYEDGRSFAIDRNDEIITQTAGERSEAKSLPATGSKMGTGGLVVEVREWMETTRQFGPCFTHTMEFSADGRHFAAGRTLWNVERQGNSLHLRDKREPVGEGEIHFAGTNQIWHARMSGDAIRLTQIAPQEGQIEIPTSVEFGRLNFSPNGDFVLLAHAENSAPPGEAASENHKRGFRMWKLDKPQQPWASWSVESPNYDNAKVAFAPDAKTFASANFTSDNSIDLWDVATHRLSGQLPMQGSQGSRLAYTADGTRLVVVSGAEFVVFDAVTHRRLAAEKSPQQIFAFYALALSPDGAVAALSSFDGAIELRDVATAKRLARWRAHERGVLSLAFSPDANTLASGDTDGNVKLWNLPLIQDELKPFGVGW